MRRHKAPPPNPAEVKKLAASYESMSLDDLSRIAYRGSSTERATAKAELVRRVRLCPPDIT